MRWYWSAGVARGKNKLKVRSRERKWKNANIKRGESVMAVLKAAAEEIIRRFLRASD